MNQAVVTAKGQTRVGKGWETARWTTEKETIRSMMGMKRGLQDINDTRSEEGVGKSLTMTGLQKVDDGEHRRVKNVDGVGVREAQVVDDGRNGRIISSTIKKENGTANNRR